MRRKQKKTKLIQMPSLPSKKHEPGSKPIIVIDGMNMAYAAHYAYSRLKHRSLEGKITPVGIMFGIPAMLKGYFQNHGWSPSQVIICWDGKRSKQRLKLLPEYKAHRDIKNRTDKKNLYRDVKRAKKLFHAMGITQAHSKFVEGDDMLYMVVKKSVLFNRVVIISGDKDFLQLVNKDVSLYNPRQDTLEVPGLVNAHHYGVHIQQMVDFFCLVGDKSDNIPGYSGIGEVRGAKFLEKFGSIKAYLDDEDAEYPGLNDKEKLREIWERNRLLMDLPLFNKTYLKNKSIRYHKGISKPEFNDEEYMAICRKYGLKTMMMEKFINTIKSWRSDE